jgi:undecaprenyl-diphosphatase
MSAPALRGLFGRHRGSQGWFPGTDPALVSLSRVYAGVHYPGDLLGGALIGCGVTAGVWRFSRWAESA